MTWIDFRLCGSTHTPRIKAVFIVYLWHICDNALLMLLKVLVLKIFFTCVLIKMFNLFMFLFSLQFSLIMLTIFLFIRFWFPSQNIRFSVFTHYWGFFLFTKGEKTLKFRSLLSETFSFAALDHIDYIKVPHSPDKALKGRYVHSMIIRWKLRTGHQCKDLQL